MKLIVLDASVAIKWFVDEPTGKAAALKVLSAIENDPKDYAVPELFFCEMLAVLCRLSEEAIAVKRYLLLLENLGFHRIGLGSELLATAAVLAAEHHLSGYDAIYAASAKLMGGAWLTADEKAHRKLLKTKLTRLL